MPILPRPGQSETFPVPLNKLAGEGQRIQVKVLERTTNKKKTKN